MLQFAGTKQKVLEVFVQRLTKTQYNISARGIVYPFDADGFLDVKTLAHEVSVQRVEATCSAREAADHASACHRS